MRQELPEEFWGEFDQMHALMRRQVDAIHTAVAVEAAKWADASDKDV
jgi:hypothetical protein